MRDEESITIEEPYRQRFTVQLLKTDEIQKEGTMQLVCTVPFFCVITAGDFEAPLGGIAIIPRRTCIPR